MPTNYPGAIDNPTDPTSSEPMTTPSHSGLHTNSNDAVVAIETFVGTTSAPNFAKLGSPHFTGVPTAPTNATATDATTQLATDAFVQNAVAAYAAPGLRLIYVDELGADPTGVNDSSAVIRAKQTALGTAAYLLVFGAGSYLMNSAFVTFGPNQGVVGVTRTLTTLNWSGSGPLITATAASFEDYWIGGRFSGFSISGPYGSGTTSGIEYSNLQGIIIDDVFFYGLPGGAIIGVASTGYAEEAEMTRLNITGCGATSGFVFQFQGTSFDYSQIEAVVVVEANIDIISLTGGGQMQGLNLSLRGNCHGGIGTNTGAIIAIERGNASGTAYMTNVHCAVSMEANDSPGVVGHYLLWMGSSNGASQFTGEGVLNLNNAGAQCQGGVGFGAPGVAGFIPVSFSGISNALSGADITNGTGLVVMGGTGWTSANIGVMTPVSSAGKTEYPYWEFGDVGSISLGYGANTIVFNGGDSHVRRIELFLIQPSSGAAGTVTWPSSVEWPGGIAPTLSTANSAVDHFFFTYVPATGFYYADLGSLGAPLASPAFTGSPTAPTQAAGDNTTKIATDAFVTTAVANAVAGVNPAIAVLAATTQASDTSGLTYANGASGIGATFTGSVNTPIVIDGVTLNTLGQRLLVKNDTQSPSGAFNGIYFLTVISTVGTAPVFTRALDYDTPSDMNNTGAIPVQSGTANTTTSWLLTSQVVTVGTTPLTFAQFSLAPSGIVTLTNTVTLTNKRVTKRVLALSANSATPAINTDNYDVVHITAQTATITGFTVTGTPVDGDTLRISITGTAAVPFTLGTAFEASSIALPTTTVTTARFDMGFFWNTETLKWRYEGCA
jgi:hypothetical protein